MEKLNNSFALLDDEEGDDVKTLVAHIIKKVDNTSMHAQNSAQSSDFVQEASGGRRGGRGRRDGSRGDVYDRRRNYSRDSYGSGDGSRGRGRGQDGWNDVNEADDGWQDVARSNGKKYATNGSSSSSEHGYRPRNRSGNQSYNGRGRRGGYGGDRAHQNDNDGERTRRGNADDAGSEQLDVNGGGTNEGNNVINEERPVTGDGLDASAEYVNGSQGDGAEDVEAEKVTETKEKNTPEEVNGGNRKKSKEEAELLKKQELERKKEEERRKEKEREAKLMTLTQYEKLLSEKRQALESLKTEERRVALDKELQGMQLIERKQDDNDDKQKSEVKLKKKASLENKEKGRELVGQVLQKLFAFPVRNRGGFRGEGRGGHGDRGGFNDRGGFSDHGGGRGDLGGGQGDRGGGFSDHGGGRGDLGGGQGDHGGGHGGRGGGFSDRGGGRGGGFSDRGGGRGGGFSVRGGGRGGGFSDRGGGRGGGFSDRGGGRGGGFSDRGGGRGGSREPTDREDFPVLSSNVPAPKKA